MGGVGLDEAGFGSVYAGFGRVVEVDGAVGGAGEDLEMGGGGVRREIVGGGDITAEFGQLGGGEHTYWPPCELYFTAWMGPPWPVS